MRKLISLLACGFCFFLTSATFAATTLDDLDRIVAQAPDLDTFLSNPALVDQYYRGLADYFSKDRFPRESFDAIIDQLRKLSTQIPEVKTRAWTVAPHRDPIILNILEAPEGIRLNDAKWSDQRLEWIQTLHDNAKERGIEASQLFASAAKRTEDAIAEVRNSGAPKKVQELKVAELFKAIPQDSDFKAAASWIALQRMSEPSISQALLSNEPSLVLYALDRLQKPETPDGVTVPDSLKSSLKSVMLKPETLLQNPDLFSFEGAAGGENRNGKALRAMKIEFRPLLRPLHGFFTGVVQKECVGGACDKLNRLSPARWAVGLLNGVDKQFVERGGKHLGYIQIVPVDLRGQTLGSLEVIAADLDRKALVESDGEIKNITLFKAWYAEEMKRRTSGLIVGGSEAINQGQAFKIVRGSSPYVFGSDLGTLDPVHAVDESMEKQIYSASSDGLADSEYVRPDHMIYETGVSHAGHAVLLGSSDADDSIFTSAEKTRGILFTPGTAADQKIRLFATFAYRPPNAGIRPLLKRERDLLWGAAHGNPQSESYQKAIQFFREATAPAIYTFARTEHPNPLTLDDFEDLSREFRFIRSLQPDGQDSVARTADQIFADALGPFLKTNPSFEQIQSARKAVSAYGVLSTCLSYMGAAIDHIQKPEDFVVATDALKGLKSDQAIDKYNKTIRPRVPTYFATHPTPEDVDRFLEVRKAYLQPRTIEVIRQAQTQVPVPVPACELQFEKLDFTTN